MRIEETFIKMILPQEGYLLTNGETITDAIFVKYAEQANEWWEIPYVDDWQFFSAEEVQEIVEQNNYSILQNLYYR